MTVLHSQFVLSRPGSPILGKLAKAANGNGDNGNGDDLINRLESAADEL